MAWPNVLASAVALAPAILGIRAIRQPSLCLQDLGLTPRILARRQSEIPTRDTASRLNTLASDPTDAAEMMMQLYGTKGIALSFTMFASLRYGNRWTVAWSLLAAVPMIFADGVIIRQRIGPGNEWAFWAFALPNIAIAGRLLEWW
ncbi:uncharacterized protein B0I36DRAFT_363538 [Microdochium trichocladiopsis]|uniref:Uncharacterized protein n=1 Tax=Microdochium trichocladiopsis TaxID=1682393 RepID=A0A9P9BLT5_9PEZI|nr:uncharacterized protein B0I36DRAFT_363538 [Microdochium trichocladiopsis]KAH7028928.1 hypothetical protein B0I36DRAFT_363538 [Microdochium trichocladiopsis]